MIKKLFSFIGLERDRIALAGYERTCREHTYDRRLVQVLDFALSQREAYFAARNIVPTEQIDWPRFEQAVQSHNQNRAFMFLKGILVKGCSVIWGPQRGPRAARRLVFELSWRLAGAHTYAAAGWPGRMFYEVS